MTRPRKPRWLRSFFHPEHAYVQIQDGVTFAGGLDYWPRRVLWFPFLVFYAIAFGLYTSLLVLALGYPLHWRWFLAKLWRERRERRERADV
jgi:hypothetical protein